MRLTAGEGLTLNKEAGNLSGITKFSIKGAKWDAFDGYFTVGEGKNANYIELKIVDGNIEFYWETSKEYISFANKGWVKKISVDHHDIEGSHLKSYEEIMNDFVIEKQADALSRGITKVSNGYIVDNTYYETLEEILGGNQDE